MPPAGSQGHWEHSHEHALRSAAARMASISSRVGAAPARLLLRSTSYTSPRTSSATSTFVGSDAQASTSSPLIGPALYFGKIIAAVGQILAHAGQLVLQYLTLLLLS